jgi:hypothetical protein
MRKELELVSGIDQVGFLENDVNKIINTKNPAVTPAPEIQSQPVVKTAPTPAQKPTPQAAPKPAPVEIETNVTVVDRFIPIPVANLFEIQNYEKVFYTNVIFTAHQVTDGKLICDLHYVGNTDYRNIDGSAIGMFDPKTEAWSVMNCPPGDLSNQNNYYHRTALVHGEFYHADAGKIWKYDNSSGQWQPLNISDGNNYELFAVNGHLYAANENVIFEIADDGSTTHILASTRRQPAVSALDSLSWGTPTLFEGPEHSLRVSAADKIFTWTGNDWREDCSQPTSSLPPQISPGGVFFRTTSPMESVSQDALYYLDAKSNSPALYLWQKRINPGITSWQTENAVAPPDLFWEMPTQTDLREGAVAYSGNQLFMFIDHSEVQNDNNQNILPRNGYHGELLCFSTDLSLPEQLFLRFDSTEGRPPVDGNNTFNFSFGEAISSWISMSDNGLMLGQEFPRSRMPSPLNDSFGRQYNAGIWLIPVPELELAVAAQKKIQLEQLADEKGAANSIRVQVETSEKGCLSCLF